MTLDLWIEIFSVVVGIVLGAFGIYPEFVRDRVDRVLAFFKIKRGPMYGTWKETFTIPPGASITSGGGDLKIVHFGEKVTGRRVSPEGTTLRCRATFVNNRVTGEWFDVRHEHSSYRGSFQLTLEPDGLRAVGQWIGFGKNGDIRNGEMIWERAT